MRLITKFVLILLLAVGFSFAYASKNAGDLNVPVQTSGQNASPQVASSIPSDQENPTTTSSTYFSQWFNIIHWSAGILVGIGGFFFFKYLHNTGRVARDWLWPLIPVVFLGYAMVMLPVVIAPSFYESWGATCFKSVTYAETRESDDNNADKTGCTAVQWSPYNTHTALGLNAYTYGYKQYILGGASKSMYPIEMNLVIWLSSALTSLSIYLLLLGVRRRFFVH